MVVVCLLVIACVPDRYVAPRARLNGGTSAGTRSGAQAHQPDGVPPSTLLESGVSADLGNDDRVHVAQVYRWSADRLLICSGHGWRDGCTGAITDASWSAWAAVKTELRPTTIS